MTDTVTVPVALGPRSYDICIGDGVLATEGARLRAALPSDRCIVVTDETVAGLHLGSLTGALDQAGVRPDTVVTPPGEATKSHAHLGRLLDALLDKAPERDTAIIALGGGVVGDLAGLAASILLRGVPFVQAPTTLLALVDSSVGGKTGINTRHGKNLVGSFYQPKLVLADVGTLATLPERARRAGYAEVVKYALIGDRGFFDWLDTHGAAAIAGDAAALTHAVRRSCEMKAEIVADDERESGRRALLNLGHTFAHAFEAEAGYDDSLLHGEAVAAGLGLAFALSAQLGLCPQDDARLVREHLDRVSLPSGQPARAGGPWDAARLIDRIGRDKKVRDGKPTFILARGIGAAFITHDVNLGDVAHLLSETATA